MIANCSLVQIPTISCHVLTTMEHSLVAALLDGIAAMRHALRDNGASLTPRGDRALSLQQCAQLIEPTTLLLGELTDQAQQLRAAANAADEEQEDDPSASRKSAVRTSSVCSRSPSPSRSRNIAGGAATAATVV